LALVVAKTACSARVGMMAVLVLPLSSRKPDRRELAQGLRQTMHRATSKHRSAELVEKTGNA
jgi:hypothetical protein